MMHLYSVSTIFLIGTSFISALESQDLFEERKASNKTFKREANGLSDLDNLSGSIARQVEPKLYDSKPVRQGLRGRNMKSNKRDELHTLDQKLSEDVLTSFRMEHNLKIDASLDFHEIKDNKLNANGIIYSIDELEAMDVYAEDATYMEEGEVKKLKSNLLNTLVGKDGDDTIFVTKNEDGDIQTIDIIGEDGSDFSMATIVPGIMSTIEKEVLDKNFLNKFKAGFSDADNVGKMHEFVEIDEFNETEKFDGFDGFNKMDKIDKLYEFDTFDNVRVKKSTSGYAENLQNPRRLQSSCSAYNVIEVAAAFDSTLCASIGKGSFHTTKRAIEQVVARTSLMYENQGVCTKIKISHMEGFCNSWSDPYRGAVNTNKICHDDYDILKAFKKVWNENRKEVRRDTAHLFYGRNLKGKDIGCAWIDTLCNNSYGYGVNQLSYSGDLNQRASLFAHELGHNIGLQHVNEGGKIMSASSSAGDLMWTSSSIRSIQKKLLNNACIHTSDSNRNPPFTRIESTLATHKKYRSPNGQFALVFQGDGNLVLYGPNGAEWASNTVGRGDSCFLQGDGNLVIYKEGKATWASHTHTYPGAFLSVLDNGCIAIYDKNSNKTLRKYC